ncbi:MAG: Gfo/Idh/MocA family oxidoreductase [Planctomycetia bacterium]|nr:Gfo/Idh/MocA family oxidoreductase [Planctomycetia bacterium]
MSRRSFTALGTAAAIASGSALFGAPAVNSSATGEKIIGANDRIRCAFVGVGTRGTELLEQFKTCEKTEIAAFSDANSKSMDKAAEKFNPKGTKEKDFRKLLDPSAKIDAVVIATPDHWHAYQMLESCKAGKDIYVEKPLCNMIGEGKILVEAARKYKTVVQVGFQHRSAPLYRRMFIENRGLFYRTGNIPLTRSCFCNNMNPGGIGRAKYADPPAELDWDLWMGPAYNPYQENVAPFKFRWWSEFSSPIASFCVHLFDIVRWAYGERNPIMVSTLSSQNYIWDDRTVPVTAEICFKFPSGRLFSFSYQDASGNPMMATDDKFEPLGDIEFRGSIATMYLREDRILLKKEKVGMFQSKNAWRRPDETVNLEPELAKLNITKLHIENFLACMRSRDKTYMPVEEGNLSTLMAQMVNASFITGMNLEWDRYRDRFANHLPANELLMYEYRAPWKLEP